MSENQFCNPVKFKDGKRHTNPDPFVLRWCGKYYCYSTDAKGVNLSISSDLVNWEYLGLCISGHLRLYILTVSSICITQI